MSLIQAQQKRIEDLRRIGLGGLLFANHTPSGGFTRWSLEPSYPIDYRSILANEIIVETDSHDTEENKRIIRKMTHTLEKNWIPYEVFDSGGKGYHLHLFFKANFDGLRSLVEQAEKYEIGHDDLRYRLFEYLLGTTNLSKQEIQHIDKKCVRFNAYDPNENRKGRLIRAVGGRKPFNGEMFYKSYLAREVEKKRISSPENVLFPPKPQLWRVPRYLLRNILEREIRIRKARSFRPIRFKGKYLSLDCIKNLLERGLGEPNRNLGSQILATACYLDGLSREEAEVLMKQYASKCKGSTPFSHWEGMAWFNCARNKIGYFGWCGMAQELKLCERKDCCLYRR